MIKRFEDMITEIRENMRDGKGSVKITHIFEQKEFTTKVRLFAKFDINPGCSIGLHEHKHEEEVYYIISGKGKLIDNNEESIVNSGDAVLTGNGGTHSIENIGSVPLIMFGVIILE